MNQLICGELSLNDQKSCNNCIRYFSDGCDHVVLKVAASEDVQVVNLEQFKGKLDSYNSRVALFAYRVKETAFLNDKATRAMDAFRKMSPRVATDMGNGFLFVPIPYPEVDKW